MLSRQIRGGGKEIDLGLMTKVHVDMPVDLAVLLLQLTHGAQKAQQLQSRRRIRRQSRIRRHKRMCTWAELVRQFTADGHKNFPTPAQTQHWQAPFTINMSSQHQVQALVVYFYQRRYTLNITVTMVISEILQALRLRS